MSSVSLALEAPAWHEPLLEFLPLVRSTAAKAFRHLPYSEREEAVSDVVADSTAGFARLAARGRPHFWLIPALAKYAVRKRNAGRRVGSPANRNDVLSPVPRREARVESWDALEQANPAGWRAAIADSRRTNPAETACFNVDFEQWLQGLPPRHRSVALALIDGERPGELAARLGVSPARVSQLRAELRAAWAEFQGEGGDGLSAVSAAA